MSKVFCAIEEEMHDISECKTCKYNEEECGCVYWEWSGDAEMYRSEDEVKKLRQKTRKSWKERERKEIWYDTFRNEYCVPSKKKRDEAPPERYLRTVRGCIDVYVEHWVCSGSSLGNRIDIACPAYRYNDKDIGILDERRRAETIHNVTLQYILWWEIPPTEFDKYVKHFGLLKESKGREKNE